MIVFDGDSLIAPDGFGIPKEKSWPYIVTGGVNYTNLATAESTAAKVLMRLWRAIELNPRYYILQIGQWSQNHEVPYDFEKNLREVIEELNWRNIKTILVTPPLQIQKRFNVDEYCKIMVKCSRIYKTSLVDLNSYMKTIPLVEDWFINDNAQCHFNPYGSMMVASYFNRTITLDRG